MIDHIVGALKISLAECKKFTDPHEYIFELNQVLNRYKTNMFKMVTKDTSYAQDPKEFFHARIVTGWRTKRNYDATPRFLDSSPIMLYLNGYFMQTTGRQNHDITYHRGIDITDLIDLHRIRAIKDDYYAEGIRTEIGYLDEEDTMAVMLGSKVQDLSMYFHSDKTADDVIIFNFQLNSKVYDRVQRQYDLEVAERMTHHGPGDRIKKKKEPVTTISDAPIEVKPVLTTVEQVDRLFGGISSLSTKERIDRAREVVENNKKRNSPHKGVPHKRHKYW